MAQITPVTGITVKMMNTMISVKSVEAPHIIRDSGWETTEHGTQRVCGTCGQLMWRLDHKRLQRFCTHHKLQMGEDSPHLLVYTVTEERPLRVSGWLFCCSCGQSPAPPYFWTLIVEPYMGTNLRFLSKYPNVTADHPEVQMMIKQACMCDPWADPKLRLFPYNDTQVKRMLELKMWYNL
jgi:hypothetical protein